MIRKGVKDVEEIVIKFKSIDDVTHVMQALAVSSLVNGQLDTKSPEIMTYMNEQIGDKE